MSWLNNEVGASVTGTKFPLFMACVDATVACKLRGIQEKVSMSSWHVPLGRCALMGSRCKSLCASDNRFNGHKELLRITNEKQ